MNSRRTCESAPPKGPTCRVIPVQIVELAGADSDVSPIPPLRTGAIITDIDVARYRIRRVDFGRAPTLVMCQRPPPFSTELQSRRLSEPHRRTSDCSGPPMVHRPEGPGVSPLRDLPRSAPVRVREVELCSRCTQALRCGAGWPGIASEARSVATPTPIGPGVVELEAGSMLLFEAVPERLPHARTPEDWRSIGHTLAALH